MAKLYTPQTWTDEELADPERYNTLTDAGVPIASNIRIDLASNVVVAGSPVNASRLNHMEDGIDGLDTKLANNVDLFTTAGTSTAYTLTTSTALALVNGEIFRVKFNATAGATPTLNRDSLGAKSIKYYDSVGAKQAVTSAIILANMVFLVLYDGTDYLLLNIPSNGTNTHAQIDTHIAAVVGANAHGMREVLTAARTYYVRTDGSDSNTGLANTAGGAFLTVQKAIDVTAALDLSIYNVTIQLAAGTYTQSSHVVLLNAPFVGKGTVTILGDTTTPANVILNSSAWICIEVNSNAILHVSGLKIQASVYGLYASTNSSIYIDGKMDFGACSNQLYADQEGLISCVNINYNITAGGVAHFSAEDGGMMKITGNTITISGTPAFSTAFAYCSRASLLSTFSQTYSGTGATGTRYAVAVNGTIFVNGGGANYFPGDVAGTTATGGQYV